MPLLEFKNISFAYEEAHVALKNINLVIEANEKIAVIGPNGAGKSTFFLASNGVLTPTTGSIFLRGEQITTKKKSLTELRKNVGIVFQDPNQQIIASTVETEVSFGPMNLGLAGSEVEEAIDYALAAMNLEDFRDRVPQYLSGGEKKRLTIADVLAMKPQVILFDEPTAFLDGRNCLLFEQTLGQLEAMGKTLIISTHDMDFAWRWATRVLVFLGGQIVKDAAPEAVFADTTLLEKAGLATPILLQTYTALQQHGLLRPNTKAPKTVAELKQLLSH